MFPHIPYLLKLLAEERIRNFHYEAEGRRLLREAYLNRPPRLLKRYFRLVSALGRFMVSLGRRLERLAAARCICDATPARDCKTVLVESKRR